MVRRTGLEDDDGDPPAIDPRCIETHPAIFWTTDRDGRLTIASDTLAARMGVPQRNGEPWAQLSHALIPAKLLSCGVSWVESAPMRFLDSESPWLAAMAYHLKASIRLCGTPRPRS